MKVALAAGLILLSTSAHAYTGNELVSACQSQGSEFFRCMGYIEGFVDGVDAFKSAYVLFEIISGPIRKPPYGERDTVSLSMGYCFPKGVTLGQMRNVFLQYAAQNPADTHRPAEVLLAASFSKAFPCASQSR